MSGDPEIGAVLAVLPPLRAYARAFLQNPGDADALVGRALQRIGAAQAARAVSATPRTAFRALREEYYGAEAASRQIARPGDDIVPAAPRAAGFDAAFHSLPAPEREVLLLTGGANLDEAEAAAIMGLESGTVSALAEEARRRLEAMLDPGAPQMSGTRRAPAGGAAPL